MPKKPQKYLIVILRVTKIDTAGNTLETLAPHVRPSYHNKQVSYSNSFAYESNLILKNIYLYE